MTVIFLTTNDVPEKWARYHKKVLIRAIGTRPLITISGLPLDFGKNIIQNEPRSRSNIYLQMLKGAKVANTDFIAIAEDDALYPKEHFEYRPEIDVFAYNNSHWSLFTWGVPTFHWNDRMGNYSLIANRKLVINALEKIFGKYPNGIPEDKAGELGRAKTQISQGIRQKLAIKFFTEVPIIIFHHERGFDDLAKRQVKKMGPLRALEIPYWGKAEDLARRFR